VTGKGSGQPRSAARDMAAPPPPALQTAALEGSTAEVERLLAEGANIEEKGGRFAWTALHAACSPSRCSPSTSTGEALVVQLLLDHNADVSSKDKNGATPLHSTATWGSEAAAGLLLRYNADVSAKEKYGQTPLHNAATYGEELVAELLLQNNADVSAKDRFGRTPLHNAVRYDRVLVVELLLAEGADVSVKDRCGNTPREDATRRSHHQIAAMIEAVEESRAKCVAFSMGLEERLGAQSCVHALDAEMLRLVLDNV